MSTVGEVITQVRNRYLRGYHRGRANQLDGGITDTDTSLTLLQTGHGVGEGSYLEIDQELMLVTDYNASSLVAQVVRSVRGTTPAAHSDGDTIEVNPRHPRYDILEAMRDEIRSWPPELWTYETVDGTMAALDTVVDVASLTSKTALFPLRIWRQGLTHSSYPHWKRVPFVTAIGVPTAGDISALIQQRFDEALTLRINVAVRFDTSTFDESTDLTTAVGVTESQHELVALGAAYRVLANDVSVRLQHQAQGESRRAEEVQARDVQQWLAQLEGMHARRKREEVMALYRLWGLGER